jgi:hypothetical protein
MLQHGDVLRTWVLPELPGCWSCQGAAAPDELATRALPGNESCAIDAEEIQPHRLAYLDLEGPLSDDRGSVTRIDRGRFETLELGELRIRVRLAGQSIRGTLELTRPHLDMPLWKLSLANKL